MRKERHTSHIGKHAARQTSYQATCNEAHNIIHGTVGAVVKHWANIGELQNSIAHMFMFISEHLTTNSI